MRRSADKSEPDSNKTFCERIWTTVGKRNHQASSIWPDRCLGKTFSCSPSLRSLSFSELVAQRSTNCLYKGELKSVKIGGSRRIRYSDLGEYVRYLDDAS